MDGYSKKSLIEKLGIKENYRLLIIDSPKNYFYTLGKLPDSVKVDEKIKGSYDFIQFFIKDKKELAKKFPVLKKALVANGSLWISWPKGPSGIIVDINENIVREIGLKNGLVDIKIVAVDNIWSGLKFVLRLKDRKQ